MNLTRLVNDLRGQAARVVEGRRELAHPNVRRATERDERLYG